MTLALYCTLNTLCIMFPLLATENLFSFNNNHGLRPTLIFWPHPGEEFEPKYAHIAAAVNQQMFANGGMGRELN